MHVGIEAAHKLGDALRGRGIVDGHHHHPRRGQVGVMENGLLRCIAIIDASPWAYFLRTVSGFISMIAYAMPVFLAARATLRPFVPYPIMMR